VILAARGARDLDGGEERINDSVAVAELCRKARRIHIRAILTAALLTLSSFYL